MFDFIIPICIRTKEHFDQLLRCIERIREYHAYNRIILIDDSDLTYTPKICDYIYLEKNILLVPTIYKGSADQQIFKVFLHYGANKAVMMQDSMLLEEKLDDIDSINGVKFLWHFTNHRVDWDKIYEPQTEFNQEKKIQTHTDLIRYHLLEEYTDFPEFLAFALNGLENKNTWCGCLGNVCVIDRNTLLWMDSQVSFIDKFTKSTSNRNRRVNESIFPLICHYLFPGINFEDSYDGLYYDGYNPNEYLGHPTGFGNLTWCCRKKKFSKISFNR